MTDQPKRSQRSSLQPNQGIDQQELANVERRLKEEGVTTTAVPTKLTSEQVERVYAAKKSFEQIDQDDEDRRARREERLPRRPALGVSAAMSGALFLVMAFLVSVQALWLSGSIPGIFLSFTIAIVVYFCAQAAYRYSERLFDLYGMSLQRFIWIYLGVVFTGIVLSIGGLALLGRPGGYLDIVLGSVVHFCVLWLVLRTLFPKR